MSRFVSPWDRIPSVRAVPVLTDAERMEAKRREKIQSHASSHGFQIDIGGDRRPERPASLPQTQGLSG